MAARSQAAPESSGRVTGQTYELLFHLYRSIPYPVWLKDPEGVHVSCNPAFERLVGLRESEIVGQTDEALFGPEMGARFRASDRAILAADRLESREEWLTFAATGHRGLFETTKIPLRDGEGRVLGVLGVSRDITGLHRAEEEANAVRARVLADARSRLEETQFAMDRAGIGIQWVDMPQGTFSYVNDWACEMLGYTREEMLGLAVSDLDPSYPGPRWDAVMANLVANGSARVETERRRKDGSLLPVELTLHFQALSADGRGRVIVFVTDISERRAAERALIEARDAAEVGSRAKTAFLANMSHEIRTPMNAILGMTYLMRRESGLTPKQAERLTIVDDAARRLLGIIDQVLELSRIEGGGLHIEASAVDLSAIVRDVAARLGTLAADKGLSLRVEVERFPAGLCGDPQRLRQALHNYVANAIKFTEGGTIVLRARPISEQPGEVVAHFEVEDTGVGISADSLPRLFAMFEQADNSSTRRYGGVGLGLALTRRLAELMGGAAGATSTPGRGSTFWFTARLQRPASRACAPSSGVSSLSAGRLIASEHAGKRVLLAEDEPVNRVLLMDLLESVGLDVSVAEDGLEAVALAERGPFDLVLLDVHMPRLGGLEAARRIRATPSYGRTPIIAVTASVLAEDRAQCASAGMDDFLPKPAEAEALFSVLVRWLGAPRAS